MKTYFKYITIVVVVFLALTSCCADLIVTELSMPEDNIVRAEITNIGNKDAGNFMVYFNGDENPMSLNHRPQVRFNIPGLNKGETTPPLIADFNDVAHVDNNNLGNIFQYTVLVDPKGMVKECNENNNSRSVPVGAVGSMACVDFGPPPAAGTQYGSPVGNTSGDVVMSNPNGIEISVHDFRWGVAGGTFGSARIETPPGPIGTGLSLGFNNINFEFDFANVGFAVSKVKFNYLDLGGMENLSINGQPAPIFSGELTSAPAIIGGVNVAVTSTPFPGGHRGTVTLTGAINRIRVGGQEFWIDDLCAKN